MCGQSISAAQQRRMCAMSAPSNRSRSMMYAFIQIISSGAQSFTGMPSNASSRARSNHESSTSHNPLPARKIRSTISPSYVALASQCGNVSSVLYPARASARSAAFSAVRIPCIGVIGDHDYESGKPETVANILDQTGVTMLKGEAVEIAGVGFAGICGFGGGFGRRMLNAWGEPLIKQFVQESISHAIRLEQALVKLQTERRIAVLHYSPIRATLEGEDPEIFAFLGSSRLEEPINRFRVSAVFHGHAHNGILNGPTATGVPVYNVSAPAALQKSGKPYRIIEL